MCLETICVSPSDHFCHHTIFISRTVWLPPLQFFNDTLWYQVAFPNKCSKSHFQNGNHITTYLKPFIETLKITSWQYFVINFLRTPATERKKLIPYLMESDLNGWCWKLSKLSSFDILPLFGPCSASKS